MNFMYDLICRRPDNYQSDSSNKNGKSKLKQGSNSQRKSTNIMNQRDQMSLLTPIDHGQVAKGIYFGQVRVNPQQNVQVQQQQQNQLPPTKTFYRTLQKNAQTILTQKNVWDLETTPQQSLSDQKNQRNKTDFDTFKTFEDRMNKQLSANTNNTNTSNINNETNYNTNNNNNCSSNNEQNDIIIQNQTQVQIDRITTYQADGNFDIRTAQKLNKEDEAVYNIDLSATAQNNDLAQGSVSSHLNSSNNQFRISKSKNGLRTPKYNSQKQVIQSQLIYEQKQLVQKDQVKSKSQQRNRTKRLSKNHKTVQPDTYEMLREAQNRLKVLQQSRFNNYNDVKTYNSDIKNVYTNLNQPLTEISNISYEKTSNNPQLKTQQLQKQSTQLIPPQYPQKQGDTKKRGSCFAKLHPALINQQIQQNELLHQYNSKNELNANKLIDLDQQESTNLSYQTQQHPLSSHSIINHSSKINSQNISSKNLNQQQMHEDNNHFQQNNLIQLSQLNNNNIQISSKLENYNPPSKSPQPHLVHAQSSIIENERIPATITIDQTRLLSCPRKQVSVSDEDKKMYGDRFIDGYQKLQLLGKGGFALVWLAKSHKTGLRVAVKQICKTNGSDSHMREMRINQQFFDTDGEVKEQYLQYPGMNNLLKCYEIKQTQKDIFIIYELGGGSLSSILYEIKGEFYKSERVYKINFAPLHDRLFQTKSNNLLRSLMKHFFNVLELLQQQKIVHCDVKPENILVELDSQENQFENVHLIDFGSCFSLKDTGSVGMATPEYLAPEMLEIFSQRFNTNNQRSQIEQLAKTTNAWSVDMWSMGAAMLEILTGLPHWLGYKCRIVDKQGKSSLKYGLFSTKGQDYEKIIQKQQQFCDNFNTLVKEITKQFDCPSTGKRFQDLLKKMMKFNANERISPSQALQHSFFTQIHSSQDISSGEIQQQKTEN